MSLSYRRGGPARAILAACAVGGFVCTNSAASRAADISADGAAQLEQQVRDWIAALLGPAADPGDRPVHFIAESDHYRMEVPYAGKLGTSGASLEGDPLSAKVMPLDGGRWALDDIRIPSPMHVHLPATSDGMPGDITISVDAQDQHAVLDPTLATESHWDGTLKGYTSSVTGIADKNSSSSRVEDFSFHMSAEPTADGLLNIRQESDWHKFTSMAKTADADLTSIAIEHMHGIAKLDRVAPEEFAPMVHAVAQLLPLGIAAAKQQGGGDKAALEALLAANKAAMDDDRRANDADKKDGHLTADERRKRADKRRVDAQARMVAIRQARAATAPPTFSADDKKTAHEGLLALASLIGGVEEEGTAENMSLSAAGHSAHLDKLTAALGVNAPDGRTAIHLAFALDGFDSEEIPPGVYRDYLPRHLVLAQHLGGVPAEDLRTLLLKASDSEGKDPQLEADALALLAKGPVVYGIDDLSLDVGPATLKGKGEFRVRGPDDYDGDAHIVATGLDELIKQANTVEELKQGAPVLLMLKGLGQQDGATTVWDVTYKGGKLLVNGNDIGGMLPSGK